MKHTMLLCQTEKGSNELFFDDEYELHETLVVLHGTNVASGSLLDFESFQRFSSPV